METPTKKWTQKWWYEYLPPRMVYIGCQCSFMALTWNIGYLIWNIGYLIHWFTTIVPIEVAGHGSSTASCSKPSNCAWSFQKSSVPWKIPQTKYHKISINPFLFHEKSHYKCTKTNMFGSVNFPLSGPVVLRFSDLPYLILHHLDGLRSRGHRQLLGHGKKNNVALKDMSKHLIFVVWWCFICASVGVYIVVYGWYTNAARNSMYSNI